MNYMSGTVVRVGDLVRLNDDEIGTVVGIVESGQYLPGIEADEWRYLKNGVLIDSPKYGLFRYTELGDEVVFVGRQTGADDM